MSEFQDVTNRIKDAVDKVGAALDVKVQELESKRGELDKVEQEAVAAAKEAEAAIEKLIGSATNAPGDSDLGAIEPIADQGEPVTSPDQPGVTDPNVHVEPDTPQA